VTAYRDGLDHLADELRRLDLRIHLRLASMTLQNEAFPYAQEARTVYITRQEVDWLLADHAEIQPAIAPAAERAALDRLTAEIDAKVRHSRRGGVELPLVALGRLFGLSAMEHDAIVICLAPELRRKYDRIYAYLQDDITRQRPSVDLVLELLYATEQERWRARSRLSAAAPLLRHGVLRPIDDPQSPSGASGLAQFLALDPRICQFLLGDAGLDARLAGHARVYRSPGPAWEPDPGGGERLLRLAAHLLEAGDPAPVCYLHGPAGAGKLALARRTSHRLGLALVSLDAGGLTGPDAELLLRLAFREGMLHGAALHLARADALLRDEARPLLAALAAAIEDYRRLVFLTGESDWTGGDAGVGAHSVAVPLPDLSGSITIWRHSLTRHTEDAARWAADLASRYQLPSARVQAAVRLADNQRLMEPEPRALTLADLSAACRQQSSQTLGQVAFKVRRRCGWDDLVLPPDRIAQLRDICDQVRHRHQVMYGWEFSAKLSHGTGLSVLFSGPPGTGKTIAAEVLANDLDVDLYKVDLSGVVSKYVGETEKNLSRIFAEARSSNAILFFDEADALFGKRTEVSDAHDRYANIETSYLLQKMEEYEGIVVLATNLRQNIDDAFTRRIRFIVEFPFPEADDRRRIWQTLFPPAAPLAADVDLARLAKELPVTGANIRNIVLNAAFLAAADGGSIGRSHILRGARQEFEKIGKLWSEVS
jgi:ATPase family associated with various cellular activities (AAA)